MRSGEQVDGILLLDKPSGPSSNRVLQYVKGLYGACKAGHAGTLDPMASGLLPVLFGEATKFAAYLSDASKSYLATVALGMRTTTGDVTGELLAVCDASVSATDVERALERFRGPIEQLPPMYSAVKIAGQPLYRLARQGKAVARQPRKVMVEELRVLALRGSDLDLRVTCSKGTYIRALAEDIGAALGCGGALRNLRRTTVAGLDVADAYALDRLQAMESAERMASLRAVDGCLLHLPAMALSVAEQVRVRNGLEITATVPMPGPVRLYDGSSKEFIGLGLVTGDTVRALRLLAWTGAARPAQ